MCSVTFFRYTKLGFAGNTEPQFIMPSCEYRERERERGKARGGRELIIDCVIIKNCVSGF